MHSSGADLWGMKRTPVIRHELLSLLESLPGSQSARIDAALAIVVESLGLEAAFVGEFSGDTRVVTAVSTAEGAGTAIAVGTTHEASQTLCGLVRDGRLPVLIPDVLAERAVAGHPHVAAFGLGAYVGIPIELDGLVVGTVCGVSRLRAPTLNDRDHDTLHTVAHLIARLKRQKAGPSGPGSLSLLDVTSGVIGAQTLEELARPVLQLLHQVTALESTFLTVIDWEGNRQRIAYSLNTGELQMPEGIEAPWSDTLCRRALDEQVPYTSDVPALWGDSEFARAMGIVTYVSVPVQNSHDGVVGTLCGMSSHSVQVGGEDLAALELFARLVGAQLEREAAHLAVSARAKALEARTRELDSLAHMDPLTGLSNRAGISAWLGAVLPALRPDVEQLAVAFVDIDDFKSVNDMLGHGVGDEVLRRFATSLRSVGRGGDLHGRLGGDEMVVAAVLPLGAAVLGRWSSRLRREAHVSIGDRLVTASVGVATCDRPDASPEQVLQTADLAMYAEKRRIYRVA